MIGMLFTVYFVCFMSIPVIAVGLTAGLFAFAFLRDRIRGVRIAFRS